MKKKVEDHVLFEQKICALYRSLGYQVDLDVLIAGQQIDVLATKNIAGLGLKKCIIECKWTGKKSISNQGVYDFIAYMSSLRGQGDGSDGILITNATFSRNAKNAAEKHANIHLKTLSELEKGIFDATDAMAQLVNVYTANTIFDRYISLSGRRETEVTGRYPIKDITEHVLHEITQHGKSTTIFGDFGSGKSTLLRRIQFLLAERYLNGEDNRVPIFIELKDYHKYEDRLLSESIRRETFLNLPDERINFLLENSMLYILLDGFDEISSSASATERVEFIDRIGSFALSRCPTVLTCRPTYFTSRKEFSSNTQEFSLDKFTLPKSNRVVRENIDFLKKHTSSEATVPADTIFDQTIDIEPLTQEHIESFLSTYKDQFKSKIGASVRAVNKFILSVYDLQDLMTRPLLLQMIIDTVLDGKINIKNASRSYGPSNIYSLYTSVSMARDFRKGTGSQYLTVEQREVFCRRLAVNFLKKEELEISQKDLELFLQDEVLRGIFPDEKTKDIEKLLTDVRVCSFLKVSENGDLQFTHKSFAEFFSAQEFIEALTDDRWDDHLDFHFNLETLLFLSSFLIENQNYQNTAFELLKNKGVAASTMRNLICSVCGAPDYFPNLRIANRIISDVKIPNAKYRNYIFEGSRFTRIISKYIEFEKTKFRPFNMESCTIEKLVFKSASGDIYVNNSTIENCEISDSKASFDWEGTSIRNLLVSDVKSFSLQSKCWIDIAKFKMTTLHLSLSQQAKDTSAINSVEFQNCKIVSDLSLSSPVLDLFQLKSIYLHDVKCLGLALSKDCLLNSFDNLRENQFAPITNTGGYLFVGGSLESDIMAKLRDINPNLIILTFSVSKSLKEGRYHLLKNDAPATKQSLHRLLEMNAMDSDLKSHFSYLLEEFFSEDIQ